jgi:hypothetical protein
MSETEPRRPRDLALLLLAAGDDPPRERARDPKADLVGMELRHRVLQRIAALDPEPDSFDECLAAIVHESGEPSGPTRAVASAVWQDWEASRIAPDFWPWLLAEAVFSTERGDRPRRKRRDDDVA